MSVQYKAFSQLNLPAIEQEILEKWNKESTFEKSVEARAGATPFVFYEGPPSANGMPGIHHVISRTLKDLVCRYKTMQGFLVERKGGWDTHGLPVELGVEKELGITKEDIGKKISVAEYNAKCREAVLRYKKEWDELTRRMGYWVDLEHPYITFDNKYIETLWWLLSELYKKDLLYESVSIQPYSPAAGTGLSSHELNQPGCYKEVKDTSCVAMFALTPALSTSGEGVDENNFAQQLLQIAQEANTSPSPLIEKGSGNEVFFLAWTTTPWTLPSNLGLTVGANIDYVLVKTFNPYTHLPVNVILAKALLHKYFKAEDENGDFNNYKEGDKQLPWKVLAQFKGSDLEGCEYEQLLPCEANALTEIKKITPGAQPFRVLLGDFVTTEDGTGIVHTAPAFGADDFRVGKKYNIGILTLVDRQGKFVDGLGEFSNRYVKDYINEPNYVDVNVDICVKLKKENRAFKVEKYEHSYPHCWRTDKPILYYPLDAWFIKTTACKDDMVKLNKTINWKPKSTGEGRFGNWLENMVDWNLSRSRYWGTPLPVWRSYKKEIKSLYAWSLTENQEESIKAKYELIIEKREDLIQTFAINRNKNNELIPVKGLYFDLDKINSDLNKLDLSELFAKWNNYNKSFDTHVNLFLYSINVEYLESIIYNNNKVTLEDLARAEVNVNLLEGYYIDIDHSMIGKIDFHKPYIDQVGYSINEGTLLYRVPDLVDVWFDSGAMPYAQQHYPFENKEQIEQHKAFPADFIAEGVDQTRGWFYTLHAIAVMLFDSVAYKTVVSNGLVLDKNGVKMSKRLGNIVNPFETIETFGADATRWYLITNASPWDNLKFDLQGIKEVQRKFFSTLYNTYQFFTLYANVDNFSFSEAYIPLAERPEIDRWILSALNTLIKNVTAAMDDFEPTVAGRAVEQFTDEYLSNWYVRLCRRRFWKGEYEHDKISAYQTLYECLETVAKLIAPVSPFFSDAIFNNLNNTSKKENIASVHLAAFPKPNGEAIDTALEERMQLAQDVSSLVLSLRKKNNIKVRQPLQKVLLPVLNPAMQVQLQKVEDLIKAEVNVKEIAYLTHTEGIINKKAKPNFKALGSRLGTHMKLVANLISKMSQHDITALEQNGQFVFNINGEEITISINEADITAEDIPGWSVAAKGNITVALDIKITDDLRNEGDAREFINRVQNVRKDKDFDLTDRLLVYIVENEKLMKSLNQFKNYICAEILADSIDWVPEMLDGINIDINDTPLKINVIKNA